MIMQRDGRRGRVTASILYDLIMCEHRPWMDLYADPALRDSVSHFVQLLWKRGRAHEEEVEEIERAVIDERRHRNAASRTLQELFDAAGLRWFGPGPIDLDDVLDSLVDDLVRAAEARVRTTRLSADA